MSTLNPTNQLPPISEEELQRNMPKRRLGLVGWAVVAVIGFVVLPLIGYTCWYAMAWQRFETRMNEIAESQPVSVEGMHEYYALPEDVKDCTHLYLSVTKVMESPNFKRDRTGVSFVDAEDKPPTEIGTWLGAVPGRKLLDTYKVQLETLYEACDRGGAARYPVEFKDGFLTTLEHAQNVHYVCHLLYLDAWVNAHESNSAGVARAIRAAFSAARSLEYEPILVSQIIQMRRAESTAEELEKLLSIVDFTDEELRALQLEIRKFDLRKSLRRGFVGEQGMCIVSLQDADQEQIQMGLSGNNRSGVAEWVVAKMGSRFDDLLLYTECNDAFVAATENPWVEAIEQVRTTTADTRKQTEGRFRELRYGMTRLCLSVPEYPSNLFGIAAVVESKLKLIDVLLAVKRFQLQQQRMPSNVDELVPDFLDQVPIDPCDATKKIALKENNSGMTVSSVGIPEEWISHGPSNFAQPPGTGQIKMKLRIRVNESDH